MSKFFVLTFIFIIFLSSCSSEKSGARISLEDYLTSLKNEEFKMAYDIFSKNIKEKCKYEEFQKKASDNYDAIQHSRLVYSGENNNGSKVNVEFLIKIDDNEVNLFDMQIVDPYIDEETAKFILEDEKWLLDNLVWPIDSCEEIKQ